MLSGVQVILRLTWGGYTSKLTHETVGRCYILPAVGERHQFPVVWGIQLLMRHLASLQQASERGSPREKIQFFGNIILEVTAYHFQFILFVRGESRGPAHIQDKEVMQRCDTWRRKSLGAIPEVA